MRSLIIVALLATPAFADADAAGAFDVKYTEIGNNCTTAPVATIPNGRITVRTDPRKNSLTVNIDTIPELAGVPERGGKINAKTLKVVATTVQGLDGRYSIGGKVDENGIIQLVLTAEYQRHDNHKPYCTQSWNVTGLRADGK